MSPAADRTLPSLLEHAQKSRSSIIEATDRFRNRQRALSLGRGNACSCPCPDTFSPAQAFDRGKHEFVTIRLVRFVGQHVTAIQDIATNRASQRLDKPSAGRWAGENEEGCIDETWAQIVRQPEPLPKL
jgi:hypothetical protein